MTPATNGCLRVVGSLFISVLVAGAIQAMAARPATAPQAPDQIFSPPTIHTIEIRMPAQRWKLLEPGAGSRALKDPTEPRAADEVALREGPAGESFAYVKSDVEFNGQTVKDVGVRFKGNMSYSVSAASPRRPMKLDFERFAPGKRFAGLATLNLNNHALDPSQAREALAFELFRAQSVRAPRTGYALVYLRVPGVFEREFLGLYTLIEEVEGDFIKRHFPHASGLLLKPQGMRGLAYFGNDWSQYESRYRPKSEVNPTLARRVVELATLVHRADDQTFHQKIASLLDVDQFLRYVAVNAALCNFDSFLSTGHNYYLYVNPADGRVSFIPWDMNMSFGGYSWVGTAEQIADVSIIRPYVDHNRLIERVLAIPQYRDAYRSHMRKLIDGPLAPQTMRHKITAADAIVGQAGAAAAKAGKPASPTTRPSAYERLRPPDLTWFVEKRVASIRAQLDGARDGFVPAFRDPQLVPADWANVVVPAAALLASIDADRDGRLHEPEVSRAINRLLTAARAAPDDAINVAATAAALETIQTDEVRKSASSSQWANWLFRVADADRNGWINAAELTAAYRRLLAAAEFDFDAMLGGRELIEAMAAVGPPR